MCSTALEHGNKGQRRWEGTTENWGRACFHHIPQQTCNHHGSFSFYVFPVSRTLIELLLSRRHLIEFYMPPLRVLGGEDEIIKSLGRVNPGLDKGHRRDSTGRSCHTGLPILIHENMLDSHQLGLGQSGETATEANCF